MSRHSSGPRAPWNGPGINAGRGGHVQRRFWDTHVPNATGWLHSLHCRSLASAALILTVCLPLGGGFRKLYLFSVAPDTSTFGKDREGERLVTCVDKAEGCVGGGCCLFICTTDKDETHQGPLARSKYESCGTKMGIRPRKQSHRRHRPDYLCCLETGTWLTKLTCVFTDGSCCRSD